MFGESHKMGKVAVWRELAWLLTIGGFASWAQAADTNASLGRGGAFRDCTQIDLEYERDPSLTAQENLKRMDASFYKSLAQFDSCFDQTGNQPSASGSAVGRASSAGKEGEASESGQMTGAAPASHEGGGLQTSRSSQPSEEMSGTDSSSSAEEEVSTPQAAAPASGSAQAKKDDSGAVRAVNQTDGNEALENGKVPEDIPPADNDSVLEAQIRQAAINETDPEVRARLWDEYRRYKGLPIGGKDSARN